MYGYYDTAVQLIISSYWPPKKDLLFLKHHKISYVSKDKK